ncbi:MAG: hypothetical protein ISS43_02535 [Candidatus Omnitrophica bacterium]|nr:hypothetical protein [Candidatus Omnitrophota bacterium]
MNKVFKGGNALWIIVSIVCLLSAVVLLLFMFHEKAKRVQTEQELARTEKDKRTIEIKLDHAQLELIQLKDQAQLLERQLDEREKDYQVILASVEGKDAQLNQLEIDLTNEKKQRTSLADTLAQLRESYDSLEKELEEARANVENLKERITRFPAKTGVELKKIVVKPKKKLSGKVLVVNTEFHFVVINLGKKDGISIGDEFAVYDGSKEIGRVQVEKVYDAMSTAAILAGSQEQEIIEDTIVKSF